METSTRSSLPMLGGLLVVILAWAFTVAIVL